MLLYRLPLTLLRNAARIFYREVSRRLEPLFRAAEKTLTSQYYLSAQGQRTVGPFPMNEVKWMVRCRHFSPDVLIRPENEPSWISYRHHILQATAGRVLGRIIALVRRIGMFAYEWRAKSAGAVTNS